MVEVEVNESCPATIPVLGVFAIVEDRSAWPVTVTVLLPLSLPCAPAGSVAALTATCTVSLPSADAIAVTGTLPVDAEPLAATFAIVHVTWLPLGAAQPLAGKPAPNTRSPDAGSVYVTLTEPLSDGPALLTEAARLVDAPPATSDPSASETVSSDCAVTWAVPDPVLFP